MRKVKFLFVMLALVVLACDTEVVLDEAQQLEIDRSLIEEYLAENNIVATEIDNTGIQYVVQQNGSGPDASFGSSVFVQYRGYFLDGTEFDASGTAPFGFVIGADQAIRGWQIAFQELNEGTQATLFIPSKYGYGSQRNGTIPPNSVLIFDVTVIEIRANG